MKEELVSMEVAKLLKELGFDWECQEGWSDRDEGQEPVPIHFGEISYLHEKIYFNNSEEQDCHLYARPTQNLAQRWLREVKGEDLFVVSHYNGCYSCKRKDVSEIHRDGHDTDIYEKTYEQALEAGLLASLNYLKQTKQK